MTDLLTRPWLGATLVATICLGVLSALFEGLKHRHVLARALLLSSCLSSFLLLLGGWVVGMQPFHHPLLGWVLVSLSAGLCTAASAYPMRGTNLIAALLVLLSSVLFALWPTVAWPWKHMSNSWFLWSEILYTLSAGALWAAAVHANLGDVDSIPLGFVAVSLVAQTLGLLLLGIGAQVAWGRYWAWDPVESWRLAAWLATAALAIVLGQLGWRRRRARLGTSAVALLVLLVLWGSFPLVHWLGLLSAYLPN